MNKIPDGDWTCLGCGAGIQASDRVLFNMLITEHMTNCDELAKLREGDDEDE